MLVHAPRPPACVMPGHREQHIGTRSRQRPGPAISLSRYDAHSRSGPGSTRWFQHVPEVIFAAHRLAAALDWLHRAPVPRTPTTAIVAPGTRDVPAGETSPRCPRAGRPGRGAAALTRSRRVDAPRDHRHGRPRLGAAERPGEVLPHPSRSRRVDALRDHRHCRPRLGAPDSEELFGDERPPKPIHGNGGIACAPTKVNVRCGWTHRRR